MIFDEQESRKPDHYPWSELFINAMWNGHWTPNEFNFQSDKQQFHTELTPEERDVIVHTLSAIGQIEIAVKKFWSKLGDNLPHPSLVDLGLVMAQVEVVHNRSYEKLLDVLDLNQVFEENLKLDIISGRVNYLKKYLTKVYANNRKQYVYALILFTLFVENVSLFSQFYVVLWFSRFRNVLKDTTQQVHYTLREECFIEGTEVLTPYGWVDFRDIEVGDPIVQFCNDLTFEFTTVQSKIVNDFNGDLIKLSRGGNECVVTPGHDICFYDAKGAFRKKKAWEIKFHREVFVPKHGTLNNRGESILTFEDRLKIAIQAHGTKIWWKNSEGERVPRGKNGGYNYQISITKKRKQDRLDWILENLEIKFKKSQPNIDGEIKYSLALLDEYNYKEFDWVNLSNKTSEWCEEFIQESIEWDGYKNDGHIGYSSTNKRCIDIVQTAAILAGYSTHIYRREDNRKDHYKACYKLSFVKLEKPPVSYSIKKTLVPYNGKVYCVSVSSGNIMTRHNDQTFITGNCLHGQIGIQLINTIRFEHPELFDDELVERVKLEALNAFKAESKIVDWILGEYRGENLNPEVLKEYIKNRINTSLADIGFGKCFDIDPELITKTQWMEEDSLGTGMTDFFMRRPVEYQSTKPVSVEELFPESL